jgi:hypothetical protein
MVSPPTAIAAPQDESVAAKVPSTLLERIWSFQGFLHPATVHFPIALLLVGGLFVVIGWKYPTLGEYVSLSCLFLGTLSAIAASAMGWSFAVREGYGSWNRFDMDSEIFWHRWSALIVTFAAIATSLFALAWLRNRKSRLGRFWRTGLLAIAAMVGAVGHQGGELTYGKALYTDAFDVLFGSDAKPTEATTTKEEASTTKEDATTEGATPVEATPEAATTETATPEPEKSETAMVKTQ